MELTIRDLINFENATLHAVGVNVLFSAGRDPVYSYCVVKKLSKSIEIVKRGDALAAEACFAEVEPLLKTGVRLHINFCGDGVLIKEFSPAEDFEKVIAKVFPFLKAEELFSQLFQSPKGSYASVCKRKVLDEHFFALEKFLYSLSLGPFVISSIQSILQDKKIDASGYSLTISEDSLRVMDDNLNPQVNHEIEVGNDHLRTENLLAYASAIHVLVPSDRISTSTKTSLPAGRVTFHFYRQMFVVGRIALLATLLVVLTATVLQLWIQDEVSSLTEQATTLSKKNKLTSALTLQFDKIDKTYHLIGWSENILPLYYSDQLAQSMPSNLELTVMEVGTLDEKRFKEKRDLRFLANRILIKGKTQNPIGLQDWISEIEKLTWVAGTSNRTYEFDAKENLGKFEFLISVK